MAQMNWIAEGRLPEGGRDVPKKLRFSNESDKNEAKAQKSGTGRPGSGRRALSERAGRHRQREVTVLAGAAVAAGLALGATGVSPARPKTRISVSSRSFLIT